MACRELPTDQRGDDEPVGPLEVDASRRRFLRRAAAGAAAVGASSALIGGLAGAAGAQTTGSTPGSTPGTSPGSVPSSGSSSTTSSAAAPKLQGNDLTIGVFVSSLELAVISLYDDLRTTGKLSPPTNQLARTFQLHHEDQLAKLTTLTGGSAPTAPNPKVVDEFRSRIQNANTAPAVGQIATEIESRMAATYQWAMTQIQYWQFSAVAATILPVDAQHAVAWSQVALPDFDAWLAQIATYVPETQPTEPRFDIATYPSAGA
jgi:hypothetical protein